MKENHDQIINIYFDRFKFIVLLQIICCVYFRTLEAN